jgi:hypothetical protein
LNQWRFYVLQTKFLNEKHGKQKTLSLASLRALNPIECTFSWLGQTIIEQGNMAPSSQ